MSGDRSLRETIRDYKQADRIISTSGAGTRVIRLHRKADKPFSSTIIRELITKMILYENKY